MEFCNFTHSIVSLQPILIRYELWLDNYKIECFFGPEQKKYMDGLSKDDVEFFSVEIRRLYNLYKKLEDDAKKQGEKALEEVLFE